MAAKNALTPWLGEQSNGTTRRQRLGMVFQAHSNHLPAVRVLQIMRRLVAVGKQADGYHARAHGPQCHPGGSSTTRGAAGAGVAVTKTGVALRVRSIVSRNGA